MIDSLYIGQTGLHAQQVRIDTISNNLSNVNTPAFKKGRVSFEDLMQRDLIPVSPLSEAGNLSPSVGMGTAISRTDQVFSQGELRQTDRPLDIVIQGQGLFQLERADGTLAYTRLGSFNLNDSGELVTSDGLRLSTTIRVPTDATQILISNTGEVLAAVPSEADPVFLGQIELANFINTSGLKPIGDGIYEATADSGTATIAKPGEDGIGSIKQGFLEASNVDLVEELVDLTLAQRAYELNAQIIRASDEILATVNSLRR